MASLPFLGLGLSSNLSARDVPQPYRLLDAHPGAFDFVEYSAPLSLEETRRTASLFDELWRRRQEVPALFHPVHLNLWGPTLESTGSLGALDAHLKAVGSPWLGNDVGWWHEGGQPFPGYLYLPPPLDERGLSDAAAHALHVQAHVSVPLVLENPAVIAQRGERHVLDFMAELHARTRLPLLLDLGHLLSYQRSRGLGETAALDGFPVEEVIEVHLAGGVLTPAGPRAFYVDDHTQPVREELFRLLELLRPRLGKLRAVTFEGDGHPEGIALQTLKRLRTLIPAPTRPLEVPGPNRPAEVPAPPAVLDVPAPAAAVPLTGASRPWEVFAERYGAVAPTEDPEGTQAELDFRIAVIAEALDRAFPLSRLLVLGSRQALIGFAASDAFREVFAGTGKTLESAYLSHARACVLAQREASLAAVVAFEQWAHALFAQPALEGLPPDVRAGVFAQDLSELAFATRALRRHLTQRAVVSGVLEQGALESLRQVARRAPPGPWKVALRREGTALSVIGSETSSAAAAPGSAAEGAGAPSLAERLRALGVIV